MEKKGTRLFRQEADTLDNGRNIVELEVLEFRRHLRQKVNELVQLSSNPTITTDEIQRQLSLLVTTFGTELSAQLLRSLHRDDLQERQSIVWLFILLNDKELIAPLQHISQDKRISRPVRLSASFALAGMGATSETTGKNRRARLYAMSYY